MKGGRGDVGLPGQSGSYLPNVQVISHIINIINQNY